MTRSRSKRSTEPDAPITGVATGSLGTAANLDETQVLSTAELKAAAQDVAEPPPEVAAPPAVQAASPAADWPADAEPAVLEAAPTAAYPVRPAARSRATARTKRSTPALAGILAVAVLVLVAGAGIISTLDFDAGAGPAFGTEASGAPPTTEPETPKPKGKEDRGGEGRGGCHGHGHNCSGSGQD